jgi:hypothetical protein
LANVIKQTKQELSQTRYGADAFSLELAAVGNDQGARRFLEEIDSHPEIGRYVDVSLLGFELSLPLKLTLRLDL